MHTLCEYRINKKSAECFRTRSREQAYKKLAELSAKRPGVYSLQWRSVPTNRVGTALMDGAGRTLWSAWREVSE